MPSASLPAQLAPEVAPSAAPAATPPAAQGPCPAEMALVERAQGSFCIDRWEATLERRSEGAAELWPSNRPVEGREAELYAVSVPGRKPQGYINGQQAARTCENAGKRLCAMDEWVRACRGPQRTTYPYGNDRRSDACNDRSLTPPPHPVIRLFELYAAQGTARSEMWQPAWMNDPRLHELPDTVEPTGSRPACTNEYGTYDMVGNLHEWIADPEGSFVGGFFMDTVRNGEGCSYRTSAHTAQYRDYSTGFRCCADPLLH